MKLDDGSWEIRFKRRVIGSTAIRIEYEQNDDIVTLHYVSPRPLAAVAQALVGACLKFFAKNETLLKTAIADDQKSATFTIKIAT